MKYLFPFHCARAISQEYKRSIVWKESLKGNQAKNKHIVFEFRLQ